VVVVVVVVVVSPLWSTRRESLEAAVEEGEEAVEEA